MSDCLIFFFFSFLVFVSLGSFSSSIVLLTVTCAHADNWGDDDLQTAARW